MNDANKEKLIKAVIGTERECGGKQTGLAMAGLINASDLGIYDQRVTLKKRMEAHGLAPSTECDTSYIREIVINNKEEIEKIAGEIPILTPIRRAFPDDPSY